MRNFIHVRDVCKAFILSLDNFSSMKNETYNVGLSNCNISKLELCKEIQRQIPDFQYTISKTGKDPDKRNYMISNKKIEAKGFKPDFSLQEGISELIKGFQIIRKSRCKNIKYDNK